MRRTQKQKREAAKRPMKEYYIYYYTKGGSMPIKEKHNSPETQSAWHAFCRAIARTRPDDPKPNRDDYEKFYHTILNN